jgi:hypothetical protein
LIAFKSYLKGSVVTKTIILALGAGAVALALGLPALAVADEMPPNLTATMPQVAAQPVQPGSDYLGSGTQPYNPNKVPPWSKLRNGNGDPVDPVYGLPAPGYGANPGGY